MDITITRIKKIVSLNDELNGLYAKSLPIIRELGKELYEQKEESSHKFMQWVSTNLPFHYDTAINYIKIYIHFDKIGTLPNLQEAYKQIEVITKREKMDAEERSRSMISEYRKTGEKPEGWDRKLDYRLKKDNEGLAKQKDISPQIWASLCPHNTLPMSANLLRIGGL